MEWCKKLWGKYVPIAGYTVVVALIGFWVVNGDAGKQPTKREFPKGAYYMATLKVEAAQKMFHRIPPEDAVLWNALVVYGETLSRSQSMVIENDCIGLPVLVLAVRAMDDYNMAGVTCVLAQCVGEEERLIPRLVYYFGTSQGARYRIEPMITGVSIHDYSTRSFLPLQDKEQAERALRLCRELLSRFLVKKMGKMAN